MCPLVPDVQPAAARLELPYMLYLPGKRSAGLLHNRYAARAADVLQMVQIWHPMQTCSLMI